MFPVMVLIVLSEFFLVAFPKKIGSRELEQVQLIRTVLETCLMSHDMSCAGMYVGTSMDVLGRPARGAILGQE